MGKQRRDRIDTGADRQPLGNAPFAALGGLRPDLPAPVPGTAPTTPEAVPSELPYAVGKTRKGGFALSVEKRAGGKCVTVLGNVGGDAGALLQALRRHCGAGGTARDGAVEIQGDHRQSIEQFLRKGKP